MRLLVMSVFWVLIMSGAAARSRQGTMAADVSELYGSIGRKLAEVKRLAPACAAKISSVLDDVDRMYKATSMSVQQDSVTLKELETRTLESTVLQKELLAAKQESEILKQTLHEAQLKMLALTKDVEKERVQVQLLKEQNTQLLQKTAPAQTDLISAEISKLDKQLAIGGGAASSTMNTGQEKIENKAPQDAKKVALLHQNLNLTSTSDPNSPR